MDWIIDNRKYFMWPPFNGSHYSYFVKRAEYYELHIHNGTFDVVIMTFVYFHYCSHFESFLGFE